MTSQNNIPKLRFPEFEGKWEKKKLGDASIKIGDGLHGTPVYSESSDIYFINGNNLVDGKVVTNETTKRVALETYAKNNKGLNGNTLLISINGTIGNVSRYANEKVMLGKSVGYYIFNQECTFYYHLLRSDKVQNLFISELTGSTIKNLSLKTLRETEVLIPYTTEQTKIANFLSAVDEKLTQLKTKKSLLEQYKKGVMQKLFSQELRFKDENGEDFAEWEEKRLGEVADVNMGQSPDSKSYNTDGIGMPLIQGNADIQNRKSNPRNWTSDPTKKCQVGDLILTVRAPVGAIAKSSHNACIGRGVCSIRNNSISNIEFLYQFLLDYELKWIRLEQGSTFTAVSGTDIRTIETPTPSLPEQTKIANFLSAIDEKITNVELRITKMEGWKKGLLQQMFV